MSEVSERNEDLGYEMDSAQEEPLFTQEQLDMAVGTAVEIAKRDFEKETEDKYVEEINKLQQDYAKCMSVLNDYQLEVQELRNAIATQAVVFTRALAKRPGARM